MKLLFAPLLSSVSVLLAAGGFRRALRPGKVPLSLLPVLIVLGGIGAYWVFQWLYAVKVGLAYGRGESYVGFILDGYIRQTGHLPHDVGGLSWRVEMLRNDGDARDAALFKKFHLDEPWDGPHNKLLIEQIPLALQDPEGKKGYTCYLGVRGKDCAFEDGKEVKPPAKRHPALLAAVVSEESCPWTKPADAPVADVESGRCLRWFKGDGWYTRADARGDGQADGITTPDGLARWQKFDTHARPRLRFTDEAGQL